MIGILLAWAYPDRIARRRGGTDGRFRLSGGRGAFLDPGEPFTEGVPYSDEDTLKIIILLTDGDNTFNRRGYTEAKKTWNSAYEDTPTKETCDNLKKTTIQVYTIRVVDGNRNLLQNCATRPDMFYDVDDPQDLIPVFEEIALHIKHVYLAF